MRGKFQVTTIDASLICLCRHRGERKIVAVTRVWSLARDRVITKEVLSPLLSLVGKYLVMSRVRGKSPNVRQD